MTREQIARGLRQVEVLALTLDAEARNGGRVGMEAVGSVINNRVAWGRWGSTWAAVCLFPKQFSCFNPSEADANHRRLVGFANMLWSGQIPAPLVLALEVARGVINGSVVDATGSADHYYAPAAMVPKGAVPAWAHGLTPTASIAGHEYFRLRPDERTV